MKSHRWDQLPADLNVADYDVVVLNLSAFDDRSLAAGLRFDRLPSPTSIVRLMFSPNAEIIAIGDPRGRIGPPPDPNSRFGFYDNRPRADYWLPAHLAVEDNRGTQYDVPGEEWRFYFEQVSTWKWIFEGHADVKMEASDYLAPVHRGANILRLAYEPIANTRFQKMIGFKIHLEAGQTDVLQFPSEFRALAPAASVIWLPQPDKVSVSEAIDLILRERHGVAQVARIPDWAVAYSLPAEQPIASEIDQFEAQRRSVERQISAARHRALEAASPKVILYEKGKDALEPPTRELLRQLGAQVDDPSREGVEDGTIHRPEGEATIEIKGRIGPMKLEDVRQVVQWATDAKGRTGVEHKPIIVGNPFCEQPPEQRAKPLAPNAEAYAQNTGVALVTTTQLYAALVSKQEGSFDEAVFWQKVFAARGLADLPSVVSPGAPY